MRKASFIVPGSLATRTGGYIYDARVVEGLGRRGWVVDVHEVAGGGFAPALASLNDGAIAMVDGLLYSAAPDIVRPHGTRVRFVPLIHMPLAEGAGLSQEDRDRLADLERRALAAATRVIATGPSTVKALELLGVPADAIVLALPGTDPAPLATGTGKPLQILCVATVNAGKGHAMLLRALALMPEIDWRLTCAGSVSRDAGAVAETLAIAGRPELAGRVSFAGEVQRPALADLYNSADLFVLPTMKETFGMAVAEAVAHGLPVLTTRTGAVVDLVGEDALRVVAPGDQAAFARALHELLTDARAREVLAARARAARHRLPTWDQTLDKITATLDDLSIPG